MHSILKDGNYIQYGPKIIPNPNAEGSGGGGGGGGDFSTCTLTLNNQSNTGGEFNVPAFFDDGEYSWLSPVADFPPNTSSEFLIALYKNMSEVRIDSTVFQINVSGNITSYGMPGVYYITGDCTITLTERNG